MFVHQHQLRHVLAPEHYFDEDHHRTEVARLFLPGWHAVATKADLPRPGDFLTLDLLGRPLLVRNGGGALHAFLNVCAHRHCLLTHEPRGRDPRFRCQYHGWEYTADGRTARIPDAGCFRPFDRENARLKKFRLETRGELAFVSLADDGPGLGEQLGAFDAAAAGWLAPPFRQAWKWETCYDANWKVVAENSLESYHIPCLHAQSFGAMPEEEGCEHDLGERFTSFRTPEPDNRVGRIQAWIVRRLGRTPLRVYTHRHVHPNLIFISLDVFRMAQLILPVSPSVTRHVVWVYTLRGTRRGPFAWLLYRFLRWAVAKVARQILREDAPIFADLQRGLRASVHRGVLGTREERVWAFQDYVARTCGITQG